MRDEKNKQQLASDYVAVMQLVAIENCKQFQIRYYKSGRVSVSVRKEGRTYGASSNSATAAIQRLHQELEHWYPNV